jgi:hypothetical protein
MPDQQSTGLIFKNMAPDVGAGFSNNADADAWDRLYSHFDGIRNQVDTQLAGDSDSAAFESTNPNNCSPPDQGLINTAMLRPSASKVGNEPDDAHGPTTSFTLRDRQPGEQGFIDLGGWHYLNSAGDIVKDNSYWVSDEPTPADEELAKERTETDKESQRLLQQYPVPSSTPDAPSFSNAMGEVDIPEASTPSNNPSSMSYGDQMAHVRDFLGDFAAGLFKGAANSTPEAGATVVNTVMEGAYREAAKQLFCEIFLRTQINLLHARSKEARTQHLCSRDSSQEYEDLVGDRILFGTHIQATY